MKHYIRTVLSLVTICIILTLTGCRSPYQSILKMINDNDSEAVTEATATTQTKGITQNETTTKQVTTETASTNANDSEIDTNPYGNGEHISLNPAWQYAEYSKINSGNAIMYKATDSRKNIIIGLNAGHGTDGGDSVKTYCHPDQSPKVTGGTTASGNVEAIAVSSGMDFLDGTPEGNITLRIALILRDKLLAEGYDVLMVRPDTDVQLDNVARTVICNNVADCHIAIHWDGDEQDYDKGCFYLKVPDDIKDMEPVASIWQEDDKLGEALIEGLSDHGQKIYDSGSMIMDLTQTSYSSVPSVDIELGNETSDHDDDTLSLQADALVDGINYYYSEK